MISVDLDRASTLHLLRTYLTVSQAFSVVTKRRLTAPFDVTVSPAGVGFHIKILETVSIEQNLKIRALLWDDPVRLAYALKKWALNPEEAYVDLCFNEKNYGRERILNMSMILQPFNAQIQQTRRLLQNGETEKAEKIVHAVAKQIDPAVQGRRGKQFVGCISFNGDALREHLEKVCGDIAAKDLTFKWRIYPCFFPEFDWMLVLFTNDKDVAWRRISWLKNRTDLKTTDTRLWVKERIAT